MFQKFELSAIHTEIDEDLKKYVTKKIGSLDKYVPLKARKSAHLDVHLKETKPINKTSFHCEVTLYLPQQTIVIKEASLNMYSAIDITEAKLKLALKKYKDIHASNKNRRHLIARFKRNS
ncbi:MAG TPA: ribosome-associated translation inhibitor RaiA [Patescibacteria group bacterium]|nr:ribosome-associated translation inhibitor RaiA [Patescibacteria group bacterium]